MANEAAAKDKKGGGKKKGIFLFFVFLILGAPFLLPTLTLVLVGMIPSMVALITDTDKQRSSASSIAAMNFAGVTPFILDLWARGQTMETAFAILKEPASWLVILGGAGIGKLIVFAVPQAMASLTTARGEARLKILRQNLVQLKNSWGQDVGTVKTGEKT